MSDKFNVNYEVNVLRSTKLFCDALSGGLCNKIGATYHIMRTNPAADPTVLQNGRLFNNRLFNICFSF